MNDSVRDNLSDKRYEMDIEGQIVFADYDRQANVVRILHVEAPINLRGSGAAGKFMQALMEHLQAQRLKAVPLCSYAAMWLSRHKEFEDIIVAS